MTADQCHLGHTYTLSKNILIASCRRSWNRRFDSTALFTSRFHAIFAVFSVIGRMRSDTEFVWQTWTTKAL
jgi:hypothetical protein